MNIKKLNEKLERFLEENHSDIENDIQILYEIQRKISIYNSYIDDTNYNSKKSGYDYKFNGGSYNDMKSQVKNNHETISDIENKINELKTQEKELTEKINTDLLNLKLPSTDLFVSQEAIDSIVSNLQQEIKNVNKVTNNLFASSPINVTITRVDGEPVIQFEIPYLRIFRGRTTGYIKDKNNYSNYDITFIGTKDLSDRCSVIYKQSV